MNWRCIFKHTPNTQDLMEIIEHGQFCINCKSVLSIPISQYYKISDVNKKKIVKILKSSI